jgi:hypothetical protein
MSSHIPAAPPRAPNPTNPMGLTAIILAVIGLAIAFIAPVAFLAWFFTLPAFIIGIIGWTRKNRPKATSIAGTSLSTVAFILSLVLFSVYVAGQPTATTASSNGAISHPSGGHHSAIPVKQGPKPTPTPTPPPPVPNASGSDLTADTTALTNAGYEVEFVDTSGVTVTQLSGYLFVSQSPVAGTLLESGSTVTITVKKPTPIAPKPAPKPVPKPAPRPAPKAPVAPSHPAGATARCNDGTYSYSQHRSGTCSHHHGVAIWY